MKVTIYALLAVVALASPALAEEEHHHPAPEHLGVVHFANSCAPSVAPAFDRAVALLHSFAYEAADAGFAEVAAHDQQCALAHWGRAMTHYHQLWDVPAGAGLAAGVEQIGEATALWAGDPRERVIIAALGAYYADAGSVPAAQRALRYSDAMADVARAYPTDDEIATFYALSLVATASPNDRTHARQKRAADILEPIWKRQPEHPGVPHYLIHAYDSAELAQRGLPAALAYAKIAPSAPHALHMPSHIFTRLGLWDDSIASNIAARDAARVQNDVGEEMHAMDYLTYAYLQQGRTSDAAKVVADTMAMTGVSRPGFKISYAANAMPVRLTVESRDWSAASTLTPIPGALPQVAALVWWARAMGKLRGQTHASADADIAELESCRDEVRAAKDDYWMAQVDAQLKSAIGWKAAAAGDAGAAIAELTAAADEEDALGKLPLTPGPIVPAREQLGELLLVLNKPHDALLAFQSALSSAPGRRGAVRGIAEAKLSDPAPKG